MPGTANKVEDPCQECRDRHLKCDDNRPKCSQCVRLGEKCRRAGGRIKFRYGSSARYDATFDKDQTWLSQSKNAKIQFVDQGPELENYYALDDDEDKTKATSLPPENNKPERRNSLTLRPADTSSNITFSPPSHHKSPSFPRNPTPDLNILSPSSAPDSLPLRSPLKRQRVEEDSPYSTERRIDQWTSTTYDPIKFSYRVYESPKTTSPYSWDGVTFANDSHNVPKVVEAEYRRLADSAAAAIPPEFLLTPAIWRENFFWPNQFTTTQCACLMRYYIEHLAPWFDVGDPARNFTLVVPQKARRCPPLLNAIFTAAARHLASLPFYRNSDGVIVYQGVSLPRLRTDTAVQYHNASLAYLIKLSEDTSHVLNEDLLAAAVILRYYEELDTSFTGRDTETFLHTFQIFVNAQANTTSIPNIGSPVSELWRPRSANSVGPTSTRAAALAYLKSFQHACFRVALRQETTMAFMKQRSIKLPLETWSVLQGFDEAEDFVWADRHLYHCAKSLQFCFGNETSGSFGEAASGSRNQNPFQRWSELKDFEIQWEQSKPLSFSPIHYEEADKSRGRTLPCIWYMSEVHVSGMQYLDLASILLTVYNPSVPRLGPGATAAQRRISEDVRTIVLRLCGIALSNSTSQPALVQAYMAIAICGEHFVDAAEQKALLDILTTLEVDHGWPTSRTATELKAEWGWRS